MPDDPNLFDDDDLLPSWMRELDSDQPDTPVESAVPPVTGASPPEAPAQPAVAPWQQHAADPPPSPKTLPPTVPPWEVHEGDPPPPPSTVQASTPWDVAGDASDLLAGLESTPPPADRGAPPDAADLDLNWSSPAPEGGASATPRGLPPGLTGQLPWRQETQPTDAESAAVPPPLRDHLSSLPPQATPSSADDEEDWLSAFGEAAEAGAIPTAETDRDWLTAAGSDEAEPSAPVSGTQPLPSPAESGPVPLDAMLFEDEPAGEADIPPEVPAAVSLEDLFDDVDLSGDEPEAVPPSEDLGDLEDLFAALDGEAEPDAAATEERPASDAAASDVDTGLLAKWLEKADTGEEGAASDSPVPTEDAMPDWLAAAEDTTGEPEPAPPEETPPDWLGDTRLDDFADDEGEAPTPDAPEESVPEWVEQAAPPPEKPKTGGIRRITGEMPPVEVGADETPPAWLETGDLPEEDAPQEGLSYEEWEARQRAQEMEASKTPEDRLLEEVPDWFKGLEGEPPAPPPDATPAADEPEFVPGWFLGLEDQPQEEAPDWFGKIDLSTGPLEEPVDRPRPPAPAADALDVPDWFRPGPELAGVNWASVGASEDSPSPSPERSDAPAGGDGEDAPPAWFESSGDEDVIPAPEDIPFPDLDLDQPMPAEPPVEEPPIPPADEVEDFVERFEPLAPDSPPAEVPAGDDMPNWLRELGRTTTPPGEPSLPEGVSGDVEAELPVPEPADVFGEGGEGMDWLDSLSPEDVAAETEALFDSASLPDVGTGATPEAPPDETLEAAPLDSSALNALLGIEDEAIPPDRALEPVETGLARAEESESPAGEESLDEWRALINAADLEGEVPDLEKLFDESAIEPLLSEAITGTPDHPAEAGEQPPRVPEAAPRFLSGAEETPRPVPEEPLPLAEEPQPEWVEELRPTDLPVTLKAGGTEAHVKQKQLAELPDRLQAFREEALRELQGMPSEAQEDEGPLAGISDALPAVEMAIPEGIEHPPFDQLVVTPEQERRVQRLQALLDAAAAQEEEVYEDRMGFDEAAQMALEGLEPEESLAPLGQRPRRRRRFKPDRLLVMLVMLAALIAPFATDALHLAADPPELAGDRAAVAEAVAALQAGDRVLFAFEYGPVSAGELDGLAEAVLRDVLARRAVPLTLSTDPSGAFHAEAVLAPLAEDTALLAARGEDEARLRRGEDYFILPYLAGEAVGVRSLRSTRPDGLGGYQPHPAFEYDLRGDETGLPVGNVAEDIALIVVISEDSNAVRTWAEQLAGLDVPRVALVTAGVEPLVTPYVHDAAYRGYLAGVRDMLAYNAERNAETRTPYRPPDDLPLELPNPEASRWHSMALGALVAAGLIGVGTIINLLRALGRRRRR